MEHLHFLQDLSVVMIVAAIATIIFRQFRQPVVLGYILVGLIIGPHTPPFALISDESTIKTLGELGVIFLMFYLGLEFSLKKLKEVGGTAIVAASFEITFMIWVGYELGQLFGWSNMDSIFLGAIISISSTTIIVKALESLGKTKEKFAQMVFGILIIEDILAILIIALLSGFATKGEIVVKDIWTIILNLSVFMGVLLIGGLILVPRLINYVSKFKSNEMLLITVIGLCFGVSLVTVLLGYSVALGAFLIGAIVAEARQIVKIEKLVNPVKDLFSAVFFVSIGLIINPEVILEYIGPVIAITIAVIIGQVSSCSLGCFLAGNDTKTSVRVGMGLGQIGEFSFIIAALGLSLNVTSDYIYPIAVAVSALTTLTTPYQIKSSDKVAAWLERSAPKFLLRTMEAYSSWVNGHTNSGHNTIGRKILKKITLQITVNLLLVTGIFITFFFLDENISSFIEQYLGGIEATKAVLWIIAMILCFPSLFAIWKKTQAAGMVIAELSTGSMKEPRKSLMSGVISKTIFAIGTVVLVVTIVIISSTLLPSSNVLILALILISIAAIFLYSRSVKFYARAQSALQETFLQPPDEDEKSDSPILQHPLLFDIKIEPVIIKGKSKAINKLILELQLRTETGATIIGVERKDEKFVNPRSDLELLDGDLVLILGYEKQILAAKKFMESE